MKTNVYGEQCGLSLYLRKTQTMEPELSGPKGVYDKHLNTISYAVRCSHGENSWTITDSNIIS